MEEHIIQKHEDYVILHSMAKQVENINDKMADYTDGQVHSFAERYAGRADQSGPPRPAMEALVDVARAGEPGAAF